MNTPLFLERSLLYLLLIPLFALTACAPEPKTQSNPASFNLDVNAVLGGDASAGFLRADGARLFSFPEDHGLHPGFRNEWWYLTGNLEDQNGRRFGYQVTFFSTTLQSDAQENTGWQSSRIWMAHAALSDVENSEHIALERFSRENPGLAGAQLNPFKVWLENWSLQSSNNDFPWQLTINDAAFALSLNLNPEKDLVLQGDAGLSQKSPEPGNASYYYSYTRLQSEGMIRINNEDYRVTGSSWLDREWSTSALADDQTGWDWFSLQFNDGQELMYYQLRDTLGLAHPSSDGSWTDQDALQTRIQSQEISLEERQSWLSPQGVSYGTEWLMTYLGQRWLIKALFDDQLMNLSVPYWEGAVDIVDFDSNAMLGQGYLEMVRDQ